MHQAVQPPVERHDNPPFLVTIIMTNVTKIVNDKPLRPVYLMSLQEYNINSTGCLCLEEMEGIQEVQSWNLFAL